VFIVDCCCSTASTHQRLLCVVPIIGSGTPTDPRRPLYAPAPGNSGNAAPKNGIVAFNWRPSDNGNFAIVEFVARDRAAFAAILADRSPSVKVFEHGKARRADIEAEFRKHIKNFDSKDFGVALP